jgi:hypothetical protein
MFASVPAGPSGPTEDAKWSRGMAMSMNEKLLFLWLLVVVVIGFLFHHFLANVIYEFGRTIAMNLVSLPVLAKCTAGILDGFFLH